MRIFFFSSRRRHTRYWRDWSSDVCSSDLREEARYGWLAIANSTTLTDGFGLDIGGGSIQALRLEDRRLAEAERSEERRVGKECRSRWSPDHLKKKTLNIRVMLPDHAQSLK